VIVENNVEKSGKSSNQENQGSDKRAIVMVALFAMVIRQFRHAIRQYTAIFPIPM
jgi:hypothetical protein